MSSKFGVPHLAKMMGNTVETTRGRCRTFKIPKNKDGQYGWDSKAEVEKVAAKIKAAAPAAKKVAKKAKGKPAKATKKAASANAEASA